MPRRKITINITLEDGEEVAVEGFESSAKRHTYRNGIGMCCWPGCGATCNVHVHHIVPLSAGGTDGYENFICLCAGHHRRKRLHRPTPAMVAELLAYKFYQERIILGVTSIDVHPAEFRRRLIQSGSEARPMVLYDPDGFCSQQPRSRSEISTPPWYRPGFTYHPVKPKPKYDRMGRPL